MPKDRVFKAVLFNINDVFPAGETFRDPALGLGYIKAYFDKNSQLREKVDIKIFKYNVWENILMENPDFIGISSVTQDYTNAIEYARKIRAIGLKPILVIGGIHISNLPESFHNIFDLGVIGEGEETFKELIESVYESGINKDKLNKIDGLVYEHNGEIIKTNRRQLIDDLDEIPPPDRKYLKLDTFLHVITSRGCPFKCSYCSSTAFWGNKVRFHSAGRVVDEMISLIINYHAKHISIWDDLFAINKPRLREILRLMQENQRLFRKVSFGVTARPNVVDDEVCYLLKQMNVKRVSLGIESGSNRILKALNRNLTTDDNYRAISLLRKHNFVVSGGLIIGSPGETKGDLEESLNFVKTSRLDSGGVGFVIPYPGTVFWGYAKERNFVSEHMDFSKLKLIQDPMDFKTGKEFILLSDKIDKAEFLKIAIQIHKVFMKKNFLSIFDLRTLNMRNIMTIIKKPAIFLPFIISTFRRLTKSILSHD